MAILTIRGQMGSGAHKIGKLAAERLNFDYVDREIIAGVAKKLNITSQEVQLKESPPSSLMNRITEIIAGVYSSNPACPDITQPTWHPPLDDASYLETLENVIKKIAASGSVVICGRGSQFILKDNPNAFHVLIIAPVEYRFHRTMHDLGLDVVAARKEIERSDGCRRAFTKRFFHAELEDPIHYDLTINTARFEPESAADVIVQAMSLKKPEI